MMLPGGLYSEAGGTPITVPLRYTVALPIYMLPTSIKVTWRALPFPPTVKFAEVMWMFPQYTPGEPHGDVADVNDDATDELLVVADDVATVELLAAVTLVVIV
jgi:hypothetical protein